MLNPLEVHFEPAESGYAGVVVGVILTNDKLVLGITAGTLARLGELLTVICRGW